MPGRKQKREKKTEEAVVFDEDAPAIRFDGVTYAYADQEETPAVNGVSFSVRRGEFVSVLGQNGSGKSTLARLCNGLLEADGGGVYVFGRELDDDAAIKAARRRVGIVFQNPDNQMVASIVEDDVAFGPENIGMGREETGERITWALNAVGMGDYRQATPERLSGGQKQRIAVAGVLAIKPDIIILDEATAMLDPKGRAEVIDVVTRLNREENITIILITHFMEEALLADRAIVMHRGEIVMTGTPTDIFENSDMLRTFNLKRPPVCELRDDLCAVGMSLHATLDTEMLADETASCLLDAGKCVSRAYIPERIETGGEWDITIKELRYTYSSRSPFATQALKGVDLVIPEGEFYGIIGQTGSGKTTLVQHLNALIRLPMSQKRRKRPKKRKGDPVYPAPQIHVGRFDLSDRKCDFRALRADVGMVFQYPEYQLFADTVFADVAFGLKNFRPDITEEETESAVREAIEAVGLDYNEVSGKSPFDLSGGQKRRAAIAGVIVTKPHILILDEPAAGLDPMGKTEIMGLLHRLHDDWCRTVIIVSHDMDEIAENCTGAAVMSGGEVVFSGTPHEIFSDRERLVSLGLDVPFVGKMTARLRSRGIEIDCGCTQRALTDTITGMWGGDGNAQ